MYNHDLSPNAKPMLVKYQVKILNEEAFDTQVRKNSLTVTYKYNRLYNTL